MVRVSAEDRSDNIFGIAMCRKMQLCNAVIPHPVLTVLNDSGRYVSCYLQTNRCASVAILWEILFYLLFAFILVTSFSQFDRLVKEKVIYTVIAYSWKKKTKHKSKKEQNGISGPESMSRITPDAFHTLSSVSSCLSLSISVPGYCCFIHFTLRTLHAFTFLINKEDLALPWDWCKAGSRLMLQAEQVAILHCGPTLH